MERDLTLSNTIIQDTSITLYCLLLLLNRMVLSMGGGGERWDTIQEGMTTDIIGKVAPGRTFLVPGRTLLGSM
ncbi:hypothetical protein J4Q44_G00394200 [Coregonus suidteri]|uniref:Uncharacterized protein n=1 Tax=Coregonus suidteri TaxID=861788 RepID=A0AAN8KP43_9TELE